MHILTKETLILSLSLLHLKWEMVTANLERFLINIMVLHLSTSSYVKKCVIG